MVLAEYLLVAQDQPRIEQFVRQPNNDWLLHEATQSDECREGADPEGAVPEPQHCSEQAPEQDPQDLAGFGHARDRPGVAAREPEQLTHRVCMDLDPIGHPVLA